MFNVFFKYSLKIASYIASSFLLVGFASTSIANEPPPIPENIQPLKRSVDTKVMLDIHVDGYGNPIKVKLAEGQEERGIITKVAVEEAYKRKFPRRIVMAKPESYWLRVEHVANGTPLPSKESNEK